MVSALCVTWIEIGFKPESHARIWQCVTWIIISRHSKSRDLVFTRWANVWLTPRARTERAGAPTSRRLRILCPAGKWVNNQGAPLGDVYFLHFAPGRQVGAFFISPLRVLWMAAPVLFVLNLGVETLPSVNTIRCACSGRNSSLFQRLLRVKIVRPAGADGLRCVNFALLPRGPYQKC